MGGMAMSIGNGRLTEVSHRLPGVVISLVTFPENKPAADGLLILHTTASASATAISLFTSLN
jgi:hypothetical protein